MNNITQYIIEKLKIDKDCKCNNLKGIFTNIMYEFFGDKLPEKYFHILFDWCKNVDSYEIFYIENKNKNLVQKLLQDNEYTIVKRYIDLYKIYKERHIPADERRDDVTVGKYQLLLNFSDKLMEVIIFKAPKNKQTEVELELIFIKK